jgi:hypothetical protein
MLLAHVMKMVGYQRYTIHVKKFELMMFPAMAGKKAHR